MTADLDLGVLLRTLHTQGFWVAAWYPVHGGADFECRITNRPDSLGTKNWGIDRDPLAALAQAMDRAGLPVLRRTHHHSCASTGQQAIGEDSDGVAITIAYYEITCVFKDDPTSEDAIVTGGIWLEPDQVDGAPFKCPVCGDEITCAPEHPEIRR